MFKYNASRRNALKAAAGVGTAGLIVSMGGKEVFAAPSKLLPANTPTPYQNLFQRPPQLLPVATGTDAKGKYAKYRLTQQRGTARIVPGLNTPILGYNGLFPGPTIRVNQGTRVEVRNSNRITKSVVPGVPNLSTSTHLHGSASLPQYDGYADDRTPSGFVKTYHYPNWQPARTLWYHDHNHHQTAENVFSGLAAFYPMSDQYERAQLPQGEFDVPLMVSDMSFNVDGSVSFDDGTAAGHDGFMGDTILVNGIAWPTMKVKPRVYRFRVLAAAISRSFRFALSTGEPFHIVGTDAGMTPVVHAVKSWRHGVAERYEVLIDFRKYKVGQKIQLNNLSNKNNINFRNTGRVMQFEVVADSGPKDTYKIPTRLDAGPVPAGAGSRALDTMALTPSMATSHVRLRVQRQHGVWAINGVTWADVARSNFTKVEFKTDPYEIVTFELVNESGGWFHPLHIHLIDMQIYGRNTTPDGKAHLWEHGPKDVFYLGENETVFGVGQMVTGNGNAGGRYLTHCHNLIHEDSDMMTQFSTGDYLNVNHPITAAPAVHDTQAVTVPKYAARYPLGH